VNGNKEGEITVNFNLIWCLNDRFVTQKWNLPRWSHSLTAKIFRPSLRFLFVGLDEERILHPPPPPKKTVDARDELLAGILDPAARIKKKREDQLRRTTHELQSV
jgi:hypothetical protein